MADDPNHDELSPPREWLEALALSEADLAAGRTVPWREARARLLANFEEIEAEPTDVES
nr:hypothetical protein [uncultured Rhodopila sp.]